MLSAFLAFEVGHLAGRCLLPHNVLGALFALEVGHHTRGHLGAQMARARLAVVYEDRAAGALAAHQPQRWRVVPDTPGGTPLPQPLLGASLALELVHIAFGQRPHAHQPLGARRTLVVVHDRGSVRVPMVAHALVRLPTAQQRAAIEPPLEVAPLRHAAHPRAGRRHRVELRILVERERWLRGLRRRERAHVPPHL
eukprot:scaffold133066_cov72-Phaeocystis_antarctica.AAC.2